MDKTIISEQTGLPVCNNTEYDIGGCGLHRVSKCPTCDLLYEYTMDMGGVWTGKACGNCGTKCTYLRRFTGICSACEYKLAERDRRSG